MADNQAIIAGSLTLGSGTDYRIRNISGLGSPSPRTYDLNRGDNHGMVGGPERTDPRHIRLDVEIWSATAAAAVTAMQALKAVCSTRDTDTTLAVDLPGIGAMTFYGRPRGVEVELSEMALGIIPALVTFVALDPVGYGAAASSPTNSGSFTITNTGAATNRATLVVTGAGTIENTTTGGQITLTGAGPLTVDLAARTVTNGAGANRFYLVDVGATTWFNLAAGANDLVATGPTNVAVSYLPALL